MVFLSAKHIAVKRDQDRTSFDRNRMVICDGIGEFDDSAQAAELTVENILLADSKQEIKGLIEKSSNDISSGNIKGGTTLISAIVDTIEEVNILRLAYIGNGSVFHLFGNFYELPSSFGVSNKSYRFSNILIPHVDKEGILIRHISHHSYHSELIPSFIDLSLNGVDGDIVLLFSDGISSLEEDFNITDDHNRIWRNQSENVSFILDNLHDWLKQNCIEIDQAKLDDFLIQVLEKLKDAKMLEDDASIGLIITEPVLNYYKVFYRGI